MSAIPADSRAQKMLDMRTAGLTLKEIGKQFNITSQAVQQCLARNGYERSGARRKRRQTLALKMFKEGWPYFAIASHLRVSVSRVKSYLWLAGGVKKIAPARVGRARPHNASLTEDQVRRIRRLLGTIRDVDIAERFGVSKQVINSIKTRRNYASIK